MEKGSLRQQLERAEADRKAASQPWPPKDALEYARADSLCVALAAQIQANEYAIALKGEVARFRSAAKAYATVRAKQRKLAKDDDLPWQDDQ